MSTVLDAARILRRQRDGQRRRRLSACGRIWLSYFAVLLALAAWGLS